MCDIHHENSAELIGSKAIKNYISGGKGIVTLLSPTGVYHTYKFSRPRQPEKFSRDTLFIYHLCLDNTWQYTAMYKGSETSVRLTRNSRFSIHNPIFQGLVYLMKIINSLDTNTSMKVYHEGICSICGKTLTTPQSINRGIGPKCWKRVHTQCQ